MKNIMNDIHPAFWCALSNERIRNNMCGKYAYDFNSMYLGGAM